MNADVKGPKSRADHDDAEMSEDADPITAEMQPLKHVNREVCTEAPED